ncbi:E3 ubiquitin-protein ligase RMND5A-like [Paramacrobiotus metropolitanus]|uniref:E3 ubiquitin-protein ligase RMND5A-like n=1 Tax=Paramacrobiotus metropolitanus TaxID=2943436 RepID=UPI002445C0E1|nr:E3 ubiquitin-protein ligase RMND5A-like [Paramacrobiotus metropolitanus]
MEGCITVESELSRIISKFETQKKINERNVDESIQILENAKAELLARSPMDTDEPVRATPNTAFIRQATKNAKDVAGKVSTSHRELHAGVSRLGKVIDKNFTADFNAINCPEALLGKEKLDHLSQAIVEYLFRQGLLDVGNKLLEEAHMQMDETKARPFVELNAILVSLSEHNVAPALQWTMEHREQLEQRHSVLEYKLHRLQFIELIRRFPHDPRAILEYSRHFQRFRCNDQIKDVQRLMGSLLFLNQGLEKSPYRDLISQDLWLDVSETFTKEACALLGLSMESPLTVCVKMGCRAIPMLLGIRHAMLNHQVGDILNNSRQELPIEVDVVPDYLYHSRFTCPILRQQSSEKNPPMRLNCGHVISKDALMRLSNSTKSTKIKCPYCPSEQSATDAKRIHL